jgi:hypothetical protein
MANPQRNRQASPLVTWLSRFWIYLPILIVILIMLPRLASSQFGLMDDGRALSIAQGIVHGKWDLSWDVIAGRFRPIYWGAFAFWYLLAGGQAFCRVCSADWSLC